MAQDVSGAVDATTTNNGLRLPPGWDMKNSEETTVDETWAPAVTHETIHHQKTEIIQKAITRDIHVDHYYHYVQPIKVVEVLPARHFRVDEKTGEKVEIEAPEGWQMPESLQPRGAGDWSGLAQETRHYVVDEENPNGKLEDPPPLRHKGDIPQMRQSESARNGSE